MLTIFNNKKDQMNRSSSNNETSLIRSVSSFNIFEEGKKVWKNGKQAIGRFKNSISNLTRSSISSSNSIDFDDSSSFLRQSIKFLFINIIDDFH